MDEIKVNNATVLKNNYVNNEVFFLPSSPHFN